MSTRKAFSTHSDGEILVGIVTMSPEELEIYDHPYLFSWVATMWVVFSDRVIHMMAGVKFLAKEEESEGESRESFRAIELKLGW